MTTVHLHLLLNHVPVIGALIGTALLLVAALRRSQELARTSLALLAVIGAIAVGVYFTGEPAEELIEGVPGISEAIIGRHEDAAAIATIGTALLGSWCLVALFVFRRRALPRLMVASTLIAAVAVTGVMGWTANLGGQIRHPEMTADGIVERSSVGRVPHN